MQQVADRLFCTNIFLAENWEELGGGVGGAAESSSPLHPGRGGVGLRARFPAAHNRTFRQSLLHLFHGCSNENAHTWEALNL